MTRNRIVVVALVATLGISISAPSHASILGEENAHLATLVGLQFQELVDIATLLSQIKLMLQGVNEVAAGVRQGYRIYEVIRKYDIEDLKRDAKRGLMEAFPDLRDIEREVNIMLDNHEAIEDGAFFTHVDRHDSRMRKVLRSAFRYGYRSTLWPIVYPEAAHLGENPSEVDLLVHQRLERAGLRARTAIQNTAIGILARKAAALAEDAEAKKRSDQLSASLAAQAAIQTTKNTTQLTNLAEIEAAREESSSMQLDALEKKAQEALKQSTSALFDVGSIQ